jgi:hypothetical protein
VAAVAEARDIPHAALRSALEHVVRVVPLVGGAPSRGGRLPTSALGRLRRAVEADDAVRRRAAEALTDASEVDEVGRLWLCRPDGWEERARALVDAAGRARDAEALARELAKERRRREAAEEARARVEAERDELAARLAATRSTGRSDDAAARLATQVDQLRAELATAKLEARHARDREGAAVERASRSEAAREEAERRAAAAGAVRDEALADRSIARDELARLRELASVARTLADELAGLVGSETGAARSGRAPRRSPVAVPGRLRHDEVAVAEHLCRAGVPVLVDGYNVAMATWPDGTLAEQRRRLVEASENLARRFGTDVTIVFDGADVVGASADGRRLVRVMYSAAEETADDVLRAEVRRIPVTVGVVVVTDDAEIVGDVRAMGANVVASRVFAALACR